MYYWSLWHNISNILLKTFLVKDWNELPTYLSTKLSLQTWSACYVKELQWGFWLQQEWFHKWRDIELLSSVADALLEVRLTCRALNHTPRNSNYTMFYQLPSTESTVKVLFSTSSTLSAENSQRLAESRFELINMIWHEAQGQIKIGRNQDLTVRMGVS